MIVRGARVRFESGHVTGRYPDGRLTVAIGVENPRRGQTIWDAISFEVPPDFHTHNDSVAAALMTLAGRSFSEVEFSFPISAQCAELLRAYYGEIAIGPVDSGLAPRRPGRRLGLLLSGGVDSVATWLILTRALGEGGFAVITSDYAEHYAFEARGYGGYRRDVTCRTDLRDRGWDRAGRFNFAVPLLFADYLDLAAVCTGHTIGHPRTNLGSPRHGDPSIWTFQDYTVRAGGLDELHVLRCLTTVASNHILLRFGRERIEAALAGSEVPGHPKRHTKEVILRCFFEDAGLEVPPYLQNLGPISEPVLLGRTGDDRDHRVLYLLKTNRRDEALRVCPELRRYDLSALDGLTLNFLERYAPAIAELLPEPLRGQVLGVFHECGIEPYDERDLDEIDAYYEFLRSNAKRLPSRPARVVG